MSKLRRDLDEIAASAISLPHRPRVYFEEWDDPLISGIGWVDELVEIAGGDLIFPELRNCGKSRERVVDPESGRCAVILRSSSRRGAA